MQSWHPNERRLLFATRNGTPWDQNLLLKRKFKPLLRALGIQVPRGNGFHAFRHANATQAVWGVLDPNWTLKENGSGVEAPEPLYLN